MGQKYTKLLDTSKIHINMHNSWKCEPLTFLWDQSPSLEAKYQLQNVYLPSPHPRPSTLKK